MARDPFHGHMAPIYDQIAAGNGRAMIEALFRLALDSTSTTHAGWSLADVGRVREACEAWRVLRAPDAESDPRGAEVAAAAVWRAVRQPEGRRQIIGSALHADERRRDSAHELRAARMRVYLRWLDADTRGATTGDRRRR